MLQIFLKITMVKLTKSVFQWQLCCTLFSYHCHHSRFLGKKTDSRAERYSDNNNLRSELALCFFTNVSINVDTNIDQHQQYQVFGGSISNCFKYKAVDHAFFKIWFWNLEGRVWNVPLTLLLFPAWGQRALSPPRCGGPGLGGSWLGAPSYHSYIIIDLG